MIAMINKAIILFRMYQTSTPSFLGRVAEPGIHNNVILGRREEWALGWTVCGLDNDVIPAKTELNSAVIPAKWGGTAHG
jgi:hypothetical protein